MGKPSRSRTSERCLSWSYLFLPCWASEPHADWSPSDVKAPLSTQYTASCEERAAQKPLTELPPWCISWAMKLYAGGVQSIVVTSCGIFGWFMPLIIKQCPLAFCSITGTTSASSSHCLQNLQEMMLNLKTLVITKVPPTEIRMGPSNCVHSNLGLFW